MNLNTERAKEIQLYIDSHDVIKFPDWPIVIGGETTSLPVYRLPLSYLRYYVGNGRFAVEKLLLDKQLGHELNSDDPDDVVQIRKMLLEENSKLTEKAKSLIDNLRDFRQLEPGVITVDGYVINGNRRMAALEWLHEDDPSGKWPYLNVQRLPEGIGKQNLWRIEAGLQLSKEKKEEYGPMNELLKIKEGKEAELTNKEIAAAMFEWTPRDVEDALERLKLIDNFLDHVGQTDKGGYGFIETFDLHEKFISLQRSVYKPAKEEGLSNKELQKQLKDSFDTMNASAMLSKKPGKKGDQITNDDIRDLGKIFRNPKATELFRTALGQGKHSRTGTPEKIRDGLRDGQEQLKFQRDNQQPRRLIETAIRALKNISRKGPSFKEEQIKSVFKELEQEVNKLKRDLGL